MIRLAVAGASGRMGQTIVRLAQAHPDVQVAHAFERPDSDAVGRDAGECAGLGIIGVPVTASVEGPEFDVLIDFTTPESTLSNLEFCLHAGRGIVIGTTGLDASARERLREAGSSIAVMYAPNMSVGVNLTLKLLQLAGSALGPDADVEVVEAHHKHKVDAPSGTALKMGEVVAESWGQRLEDVAVYSREGHTGARPDGSIGFATIRAGDIVGEHTVMFAMEGERIEITHRAANRSNFAAGALRAATWLHDQGAGFYGMNDVLGLGGD